MKVPNRALTVVLLLVWSGVAAAEDEALLDRAKQLYREGRFAEAAQQLSTATATTATARDTPSRIARLGDAYLHLGLSYAALDQLALAKEAFKSLLVLRPDYQLDPEIYAPKIIELFEQARLAATAAVRQAEANTAAVSASERAPRILIEGAVGALRYFHLGDAPTPALTGSASGDSYQLRLRAAADGLAGAVGLQLASASDRDRIHGRFAWGTLHDSTAVPAQALAAGLFDFNPPAPDGRDEWRVRALDVLWSRRLTTRRLLATRLEVGYRHVRARQAAVDLLRDSRCTTVSAGACYFDGGETSYLRRELRHRDSGIRDHGLRLGVDADWRLRRRWHVVGRAGLSLLARREQGQTYWEVTDRPEEKPLLRSYEDIPASNRWHLGYDLSVGVRAPLGRRCSASVGGQVRDFGPGSRVTPTERRVVAGLWLGLAYALAR